VPNTNHTGVRIETKSGEVRIPTVSMSSWCQILLPSGVRFNYLSISQANSKYMNCQVQFDNNFSTALEHTFTILQI
jgi:hypothetical protein